MGTKGFTDEQAAKQMLYKGAFAIGNPKGDAFYNPFDFDVKNVANTGVVDWGGELYALWEGGKPHKMDPTTLRTEGEADSVLGHDLEVPQMAAHYRVLDADDPAKKRLVAFSIEAQNQPLQPNKCCFYEWDADGKPAARAPFGVQNATFGMFHDCLVTENWYMLLQNPTALDPRKLLTEYMFAKCALAEVPHRLLRRRAHRRVAVELHQALVGSPQNVILHRRRRRVRVAVRLPRERVVHLRELHHAVR